MCVYMCMCVGVLCVCIWVCCMCVNMLYCMHGHTSFCNAEYIFWQVHTYYIYMNLHVHCFCTQQNEMVIMTILYGYFSCMYILLVVHRLLCKLICTFISHIITYDMYASFICDSISYYRRAPYTHSTYTMSWIPGKQACHGCLVMTHAYI